MNGMCVLQEAKLAALVSKRWEHQLEEHSVPNAQRLVGRVHQFCSWCLGETLIHSEGNSLAESWEMEECLNSFLEQFAKSPNVCHLLCTYAGLLLI